MNPIRFALLLLLLVFSAPPTRAADTHVILFIIDSVSASLMYELIDSGQLPNIASALGDRGLRVERAVAPFPTISFYAHHCILTGSFQDRHHIPGIRWFDRETESNRSYAGFGSELIGADANSDAPTLFERLPDRRSLALASAVNRGADNYVRPWWPPDGARMNRLIRRMSRRDPPELAVVVLTGIDWPAHRFGPRSEWVVRDLVKLDQHIGKLIRTLKRKKLWDNTFLFLTADHGHTDVRGRVDLYARMKELKIDVLDKLLYTLRTEAFDPEYDAVMWMGGVGYAYLYLPGFMDMEGARGRVGEGAKEWRSRPTMDQLREYPIADRRIDMIAEMLSHPDIAWVAAQVHSPDLRCVRIFSRSGESSIESTHDGGRYRHRYQRISGADPLGWDSAGLFDVWRDEREWLAATARLPHPDAVVQLGRLLHGPRTPDLLIVAAPGRELAWSWHKGRHGGYTEDEIIVPLLVIGPGVRPGWRAAARTIDIAPTILNLFGRPAPQEEMDGNAIDLFATD